MRAAVVFLLVVMSVVGTRAGHNSKKAWGYGKTTKAALGPADWHKAYPHCGFRAQSPINIDTSEVEEVSLGNLKFTFTEDTKPPTRVVGTLANNGHAPTLTIDRSKGTARISGGPVGDKTYELLQFHFHFGCKDGEGSEHTLDGDGKSGELHLVFYNTKYKATEAAAKHDGLAVIGVFLKLGKRTTEKSLRKLIRTKITKIAKEGSSVDVTAKDEITLEELLPQSALEEFDYWTYKGSLTTPPCYQSVHWIVMKKKIKVCENDLKHFRKLEAEHGFDGKHMCNNNRPTMPLNGRTILEVDED